MHTLAASVQENASCLMRGLLVPNATQGHNKTLALICIIIMLLLAACAITKPNCLWLFAKEGWVNEWLLASSLDTVNFQGFLTYPFLPQDQTRWQRSWYMKMTEYSLWVIYPGLFGMSKKTENFMKKTYFMRIGLEREKKNHLCFKLHLTPCECILSQQSISSRSLCSGRKSS